MRQNFHRKTQVEPYPKHKRAMLLGFAINRFNLKSSGRFEGF